MTAILGTNWAIWTNLAFLVPLYVALTNKMWLHAVFILLTMGLSFAYHFAAGNRFELADEMAAVVEGNPFESAEATPTRLHVSFLSAQPSGERLSEIDAGRYLPDRFVVGDRALYFWLPNGTARSIIMRDLSERRLGVVATTRNWNTVIKLLDLART